MSTATKPMLGKITVEGCDSIVVHAWSDDRPELVEVRFARPEPKRKIKIARERKAVKTKAPRDN